MMKPFNLEKALAGDPVVTRDGRKVTEIVLLNTANDFCSVVCVIDKYAYAFRQDGSFIENREHKHDLFMAPKIVKKSGWINIYPNGECGHRVSTLRVDADKIADGYRVACVYVEWEEEEE